MMSIRSTRGAGYRSDIMRAGGDGSEFWQEQRFGASSEWPQTLIFFHGTSWEAAQRVKAEGFQPSVEGCFGPGVYVGRADKATRFAMDTRRHGSDVGGLIECACTIRSPKFVETNSRWNDDAWRAEGHDACRGDCTTFSGGGGSPNMEWCIADPQQVRVTRVFRVPNEGMLADVPKGQTPVPPAAAEEGTTTSSSSSSSLPLSAANLRAHETQQRVATRRMFNCPEHGVFWKRVKKGGNKRDGAAVARCRRCAPGSPKFVALPPCEERGKGLFEVRRRRTRAYRLTARDRCARSTFSKYTRIGCDSEIRDARSCLWRQN